VRNPLFDLASVLGPILLFGFLLLLIFKGALADQETSEQTEDWYRRLEKLRSVPYVGFSETTVEAGDSGVVLYHPDKACDGYNFYCSRFLRRTSLLDMQGRVVHQWTCFPIHDRGAYHHAVMLRNGDLLGIKKHHELLRLNWNSELIWRQELSAHHDVAEASDGSFYVIIRQFKNHRALRVWFDVLVRLTAEGEEIDRWSTYDHLSKLKSVLDTKSFLDTILDNPPDSWHHTDRWSAQVKRAIVQRERELDYFHLNAVNVLPSTLLGARDPRFQEGNLLICLRNVNQIAVLEKGTYRILWAWGQGELEWPHHPTMLENGHILVFDNGVERGYSRVVELNPVDQVVVWEYKSEPPQAFYSSVGGSAQRLPNGNTLISEFNKGRAFEVTKDGEVVWNWLNPLAKGGRRETVYRMTRLLPAEVDDLLEGWWWWWRE
jgi:hypothetical protein